jgi:flagellar protein FliO/FliZ
MTEAALLRLTFSLVLIVLLLLALAWVARRSGWLRGPNQAGLKVLAMQNLGARAMVAIVEVEDARLVVGVTAQQISLLHTLPPAAHTNTPPPASASQNGFATRLDSALKKH